MNSLMPVCATIQGITEYSPSIRVYHLDHRFSFIPGQFIMVWIPGVDEVPMALSSESSITVQRVGDATAALFGYSAGDKIGLRGPFGNGFTVQGRVLAVAGGIGVAPLFPLARTGQVDTFLLGARSSDELLFTDELSACTDLHIATDDGSAGRSGYVVPLMDSFDIPSYDHICVCGPELMMRSILQLLDANGIADRGQFSLHRYLKCGMGICGSCSMDPDGLRVCTDGPVFRGDILLESEFGHYTRDASGRRKPFS